MSIIPSSPFGIFWKLWIFLEIISSGMVTKKTLVIDIELLKIFGNYRNYGNFLNFLNFLKIILTGMVTKRL
jgi:hypothetical protein